MTEALTQLLKRFRDWLNFPTTERLQLMSDTADTAFAAIGAKVDKLSTDLAADLAIIKSGQLSPDQQAAVASIEAKLDAMDATVAQPPPNPPAA